jgi:transcriptional regulator with XRE-family HTH domain
MPSSVTETVAAEVRAQMGRAQVNTSELARRIGKSHSYVWRRLTGAVPFDVADLTAIGEVLGVSIGQFIPASERVA